jgi:hypothetical protein
MAAGWFIGRYELRLARSRLDNAGGTRKLGDGPRWTRADQEELKPWSRCGRVILCRAI